MRNEILTSVWPPETDEHIVYPSGLRFWGWWSVRHWFNSMKHDRDGKSKKASWFDLVSIRVVGASECIVTMVNNETATMLSEHRTTSWICFSSFRSLRGSKTTITAVSGKNDYYN